MKRTVGVLIGVFGFVFAGVMSPVAQASPPTTADPGLPVTTGVVKAVASAGSATFIAGTFGAIGPRTGSALEFNSTTSARTVLPEISGGGVDAAVPDGSGGWYVGGNFDRVAGAVRYGLAHIRADGSVDSAFPQLSHQPLSVNNGNDYVLTMALSADGQTLYVGGFFAQVGGQPRSSIAAVATATDTVTAWSPDLTGPFPSISQLVLGAGTTAGSVFVAGDFTGVGAVPAADMAKLSTSTGAADASFTPDPTAPGVGGPILYAAALSTSGSSLYIGGYFDMIGGQSRNDLARVSTTGGSEGQADGWNPNPDGEVFAIGIPPGGGTAYIAGEFANIGGQARSGIAAINSSTGDATPWNVGLTSSEVTSIAFDGGDLLIVGDFDSVGSQPRHGVALVDLSSGAPTAFNPDVEGQVFVGAASASEVLLGGSSMTSAGAPRQGIAELDPYGHLLAFAPSFSGSVAALVLSADGKTLYAGGSFATVDGQPRAGLAAFDVASGALTPWRSGVMGGSVTALALSGDGKTLYVGGTFDHLGSDSQPRVRLGAVSTADGTATAWNPGLSGGFEQVNALALSPDSGTVYVGGSFTTTGANSQPRTNLAAIAAAPPGDATPWAPNPHGGHFSASVSALAVGGDGAVYVGGTFATAGSNALARPSLVAIDPAGTGPATAWDPTVTTTDTGNGAVVRALAISGDGATLFAGGQFDQLGGQARIDLGEVSLATGAGTAWNPDPGPYFGDVYAVSVATGSLHVGGAFLRIGNDGLQGYAQFTSAPAATAAPKLKGTAAKGRTLTCVSGTFSNSPLTVSYAWTRDGHPISGRSGTMYKVLGSDSGHRLACVEAARNAGGSTNASSAAVTPGPYLSSFKLTSKHHKRYLAFSITEKAKATIVISRLVPGVRHGHKCRASGHGRRCTRAVRIGSISVRAHSGKNKKRLGAKLGRHRLGSGHFQAVLTARDSGKRKSNRKTLKFRVT